MLFKIRCSEISQIMGGALTKPTAKQIARIEELEAKEKRTAKQDEELAELKAKRDAKPELQQGAKTYCEDWLQAQIYNRSTSFTSKYTEKGIECEQQGIELLAEMMDYGMLVKNTEWLEDDHITGCCDIKLPEIIEDVKCPYTWATFPLFDEELPNTNYYWQMQGYMALYDKPKAAVSYCLVDAPDHLIEKEARNAAYKNGMAEVDMELYDEIYKQMTYSDVDKKYRFKRFEIQRNDEHIKAIRTQVELCRIYINSLTIKLP